VHLLEGVGHFVQMERSAALNGLLLPFTADVLPTKRTAEQP